MLKGLEGNELEEAKRIAGEVILEEINEYLDEGVSPVNGKGLKKLSKKYADKFKGGDQTPDLFLRGDMRDDITFETHKEGVKVGVFRDAADLSRKKASGHNRGDSRNKTKRQFIPNPNGGGSKFHSDIMDKVEEAIEDFKEDVGAKPMSAGALFYASVFEEAQEDQAQTYTEKVSTFYTAGEVFRRFLGNEGEDGAEN